ncbi:DMT family transporter [Lihuaxuella thermophila]|uniref:Paired small multidrug resistance pump n=1 Tax=Lihuaxuella thermophila TaxID=1173111 RepID=A0A1H8E487_9BACL|nr:SMR family transporter [Lihuaxuella thermophila]SEN13924.1 paired small multidrug resistance pump [Lihuaxuella thermophila]
MSGEETKPSVEDAPKRQKKPISKNRAWAYVWIGGALEIVWASGFKYEAVPTIVVVLSLLVSFDLIIKASQVLPVGSTYAVFTAIGTIGTVAVEAVFSQGISWMKISLVLLLLLCIIGLKLTSGEGERT